MVALAGLGQAGHDGIFEVCQRQLAGAQEHRFVRDGDLEVGQQPIDGLFSLCFPGRVGEDVVERRERVDRENGLDLSKPCQAQNLRRVVVVWRPVLQNIQQDVQVEQHFHRCFSSRCRWYSASASISAGTNPLSAATSGWIAGCAPDLSRCRYRATTSAAVKPSCCAYLWRNSISSLGKLTVSVAVGITQKCTWSFKHTQIRLSRKPRVRLRFKRSINPSPFILSPGAPPQ